MDKQFKDWWEKASQTLKCDTYDAYEIWQQAQKVAIPEWLSEHIDVNYDDQREDDQHSYWSGYNQALREIKAMIEAVENEK